MRLAVALAVAVVASEALAACGSGLFGRAGDGPVTTETRAVAPFTSIDVSSGITVTVTIDPGLKIGATQPVDVVAQSNLFAIVRTEVTDGTLRIHSSEGFSSSAGVQISIVTSTLDGVSLSGGSRAAVDGLDADGFRVALSGGSVATVTGRTSSVTIAASGGSRADLTNLAAITATVDASGGSAAIIRATDTVTGSTSGGSRVTVLGGAKLNVQSSGGAEVTSQ